MAFSGQTTTWGDGGKTPEPLSKKPKKLWTKKVLGETDLIGLTTKKTLIFCVYSLSRCKHHENESF